MKPLTLFKCLADDTRLTCLLLLTQRDTLCVCDFQTMLSISQPKISRHLADLRNCDLVEGRREGKWVHYQLHPDLPAWARDILGQTATIESQRLQELLAQLNCQC